MPQKEHKDIDYKLFFSVLLIIIFWMIMISSVSVYSSFKVTNILVSKWEIKEAYNYFYVIRNIISIIIWLIVAWFIAKTNYKFFEKYSKYIFRFSLWLLIFVLIKWMSIKWASWWINIPWIPFTIQPTEFFKISLIIFLSAFFKKYNKNLSDFKKWFLPFLWLLGLATIIIWAQPDFWTLLVILPVSTMLFYYAWANIKHLISITLAWILLIFTVYSLWDYDKKTWKNLNSFWYITQRLDNFLADNKESIKNKTINYQTEQWLIAVWSWWFKWKWFWKSIQKFGYLPEVQWDFIYSVVVEELWFIGWTLLIFFYLYIGYRGFFIASNLNDLFWRYVSFWITSRILFQAFINIWVVLNVIPLTWITLPFVSYWGSSLLSLMIWLWIILSVSREIDRKSDFARLERRKLLF